MSKLEKLKAIKGEVVTEILKDSTKSKFDKLSDLEENDLWGYSDWVNHEFPDWEQECNDLERQAAIDAGKDPVKDYVCTIADSVFDPSSFDYERRETVSYVDIISDYIDDFKWENKDNKDLLDEFEGTGRIPESVTMTVVSNRGEYGSKVVKPMQEVIDKLCDFCFENKIIGYTNDW